MPCVTTWHNDHYRTGWQPNETQLNTSTVYNGGQTSGFGLLWQWGTSAQYPIVGNIYAQPLAVSNLPTITPCQSPCSLVFVATEQDMLYAFNAAPSSQAPVWSVNLAAAVGGSAVDCASPPVNFDWCKNGSSQVGEYVGVTGTPVIDASTNTLYVAGAVVTGTTPAAIANYFLFAVNILSGAVTTSTAIGGSVSGLSPSPPHKCTQTVGGSTVSFDVNHLQRSGLLLLNGAVYVAFSADPAGELYYSATTEDQSSPPDGPPFAINAYSLSTTGPPGPIQTTHVDTSIVFCPYSPTPSGSWNSATKDPTTGILWAVENPNYDNPPGNPTDCKIGKDDPHARLHAFNATNLAANPLYDTRQTVADKYIGAPVHFTFPTVFNGHVYVGTQTEVDVFGLCSSQTGGCLQ